MSADLPSLLTLHMEAETRHAERGAVLAQNEAMAREKLQKAQAERAEWESERAALRLAGDVYRRMAGVAPEEEQTTDLSESGAESVANGVVEGEGLRGRAILKARIGPQRYLILSQMKTLGVPLSVDQLALATGFSVKRVKDQMKADDVVNVVSEDGGQYTLTAIGIDLLTRFETYKARRGEPLPSREDVTTDDELSEGTEEEDDPHGVA